MHQILIKNPVLCHEEMNGKMQVENFFSAYETKQTSNTNTNKKQKFNSFCKGLLDTSILFWKRRKKLKKKKKREEEANYKTNYRYRL